MIPKLKYTEESPGELVKTQYPVILYGDSELIDDDRAHDFHFP